MDAANTARSSSFDHRPVSVVRLIVYRFRARTPSLEYIGIFQDAGRHTLEWIRLREIRVCNGFWCFTRFFDLAKSPKMKLTSSITFPFQDAIVSSKMQFPGCNAI
jgi:hypothetical protein